MKQALYSLFKSPIAGISAYYLSSIFSMVIGLAINPILSLNLSSVDFAIIGYYSSIALVLTPIINYSLSNYYSRKFYTLSVGSRSQLLNTILTFYLFAGLIILLTITMAYYFYHLKYVKSIPLFPYVILSFLPIYFGSFYNLYLVDIRLKSQIKRFSFVTIFNGLLSAILSLLFVHYIHLGAEGRLLALLIVPFTFFLIIIRWTRFELRFNFVEIKEMLKFSTPLVVSGVLTFFFIGFDRTLLAELNDSNQLGLYNIGFQISGYFSVFSLGIFQYFEPQLFKYSSLGYWGEVGKIVLFIVIFTLLPILIFLPLSSMIIEILTYGKYTDCLDYANILVFRNWFSSIAFAFSTILIGSGYVRLELVLKSFASIISLFLFYKLINKYGFFGAAFGQSFSWLFYILFTGLFLISQIIYKKKIK